MERETKEMVVYGIYCREVFNMNGDNIFPRPENIVSGEVYSYFTEGELSNEMKNYWNKYNKYVISKGAVLFMSSPPILEETMKGNLKELQKNIEKELDFPMISQLKDYVYPLNYFYDTGFHLNDMGKQVRTKQVIEDLSSLVGNGGMR